MISGGVAVAEEIHLQIFLGKFNEAGIPIQGSVFPTRGVLAYSINSEAIEAESKDCKLIVQGEREGSELRYPCFVKKAPKESKSVTRFIDKIQSLVRSQEEVRTRITFSIRKNHAKKLAMRLMQELDDEAAELNGAPLILKMAEESPQYGTLESERNDYNPEKDSYTIFSQEIRERKGAGRPSIISTQNENGLIKFQDVLERDLDGETTPYCSRWAILFNSM